MTIRDAIASDGRFEELGEFTLEDASNSNESTFSVDKIDAHNEEIFRIGFEKMKRGKNMGQETPQQKRGQKKKKTQGASVHPEVEILAKVKALIEPEEKHLGNIYPDLRETMLERFPKKSFAETLKKVDFGKAQQSFSDVFRLRQLLEHGESVCKLVVNNVSVGTGFVLFENYILTNAHVLKEVVHDNIVDSNVIVTAVFNYVNPNVKSTHMFIDPNIINIDRQQDYAVLELQVPEQDRANIPPGLMKSSVRCLRAESLSCGPPGGSVQMIDPTCIIKSDLRMKGVHEYLQQYKENLTALVSVIGEIKNQGIDRIQSRWDPKSLYNDVSSYHTFMYHGSSGSPVFDAYCRVFGLHSGGFTYGLKPKEHSVIEFSHPVLLIFETFVTNLKEKNQEELLIKVREHSTGNVHLENIVNKVLSAETFPLKRKWTHAIALIWIDCTV
ncbi:hypothetical protein WMY93_007932 [Mugilogobius chulae]|uniref:Serine protease n=1 Tax=Mugilogobius chulae TaxID=88201 RepID=A0AAW0PHH3_9GOBI